jgi:hypothetical protein
MSNPGEENATPIGHVRELAAYLEAGAKPAGDFRRVWVAITRRRTTNRAASAPCWKASPPSAGTKSATRTI